MYTALLYVHVLALVYWLGGDLGTYLSSRHVLRRDLERRVAANRLQDSDGVRHGAAVGHAHHSGLGLPSGGTLLRWPTLPPTGSNGAGRLAGGGLIWVGLVAALHSPVGHRMPSLAQWDLRLRFAVVFTLLAAGAYGFYIGITRLGCPQSPGLCRAGGMWHRGALWA